MTTTQRTTWLDAHGDPAHIPGVVEAVIADGPMEGEAWVLCRFHPPRRVEFPPNRERPTTLVYLLDDTMPRITYRWKP